MQRHRQSSEKLCARGIYRNRNDYFETKRGKIVEFIEIEERTRTTMFHEFRALLVLCCVTQFSNGLLSKPTNESSHTLDGRMNQMETRKGRCKLCAHKTACINRTHQPHSCIVVSFAGFPFYTIGRFQNTPCVGSNQLLGTCVLGGECRAAGGIVTGSCSTITRQALCCVCKCDVRSPRTNCLRKHNFSFVSLLWQTSNRVGQQQPTITHIL